MKPKAMWETGRYWTCRKPEGWLVIHKASGSIIFHWEAVLASAERATSGAASTLVEAKRQAHDAYDAAMARLVAAHLQGGEAVSDTSMCDHGWRGGCRECELLTLRARVAELERELSDLKADDEAWKATYERTHAALLVVERERDEYRLRSLKHAAEKADALSAMTSQEQRAERAEADAARKFRARVAELERERDRVAMSYISAIAREQARGDALSVRVAEVERERDEARALQRIEADAAHDEGVRAVEQNTQRLAGELRRAREQEARLREALEQVANLFPYLNCVCGRQKKRLPDALQDGVRAALAGEVKP